MFEALYGKGRMRGIDISHRLQLETCNNLFETQSHVTVPVTWQVESPQLLGIKDGCGCDCHVRPRISTSGNLVGQGAT